MAAIVKDIPSVESEVDLSFANFGGKSLEYISGGFNAFPVTVTHLNLRYVDFGAIAADDLAKAFATLSPALQSLNISWLVVPFCSQKEWVTVLSGIHRVVSSVVILTMLLPMQKYYPHLFDYWHRKFLYRLAALWLHPNIQTSPRNLRQVKEKGMIQMHHQTAQPLKLERRKPLCARGQLDRCFSGWCW